MIERVTEDNEERITEDGETRVLEQEEAGAQDMTFSNSFQNANVTVGYVK